MGLTEDGVGLTSGVPVCGIGVGTGDDEAWVRKFCLLRFKLHEVPAKIDMPKIIKNLENVFQTSVSRIGFN